MSKTITKLIAATLISVVVPSYASIASAAPAGGARSQERGLEQHRTCALGLARRRMGVGPRLGLGWCWRGNRRGCAYRWSAGRTVLLRRLLWWAVLLRESLLCVDPSYVVDDTYYSEPIGGGAYYGSSPYYRGARVLAMPT